HPPRRSAPRGRDGRGRPRGTPEGDALLAADLVAVRAIPVGSTRIVVLPEKDLVADDATLPHLPLRTGTTRYTRWGDWFGYLCLFGTALALLSLWRRPRPTG
ncbi:MAG TPA: hypothetical protein VHZ97_04235, partial [Pseudonocardiaceae bacterium]|nr:hypothetical protein [Pseudonocardiaceae bacterium]